jgi:hypothetical protein
MDGSIMRNWKLELLELQSTRIAKVFELLVQKPVNHHRGVVG